MPQAGLLSVLAAEPGLRAFGRQCENRDITICHEYADLFIGHPAVHGLAYGDAGRLDESFDKVIYLRGRPGKGDPMDWIHDVAHNLGVRLEQQTPQIELCSFDFVRTQRFGVCRMRRPRVAMATLCGQPEGWAPEDRHRICRLLREQWHVSLIHVGQGGEEIEPGARDLRGKLTAREIAAVLKQCDLLLTEDEEMAALAAAVQVPAVFICAKSWDCWPAAEGAAVVSVYPASPQEVLEAMERVAPALAIHKRKST